MHSQTWPVGLYEVWFKQCCSHCMRNPILGAIFYFTNLRRAMQFGEKSVFFLLFKAVETRNRTPPPFPQEAWPLIKCLPFPSKTRQRHSDSFQHGGKLFFFNPIVGQLGLSNDLATVHTWADQPYCQHQKWGFGLRCVRSSQPFTSNHLWMLKKCAILNNPSSFQQRVNIYLFHGIISLSDTHLQPLGI